MYVCISIYVLVCMYVYICISMYVCIYVLVCMYIYVLFTPGCSVAVKNTRGRLITRTARKTNAKVISRHVTSNEPLYPERRSSHAVFEEYVSRGIWYMVYGIG
jgi:hypothetical protein